MRAPVNGSRPAVVAVPRQFRAMLNHYVFHTEAKKTAHLDPAKPLIIPAGSDSFDSIGTPPGARRAQMDGDNISARMQLWGKAVDTFFPPEKDDDADGKDEAVDAQQWLEPVVDTMRAQKQYVGIHVASVGPRAASGMASHSRVCVYVVCGCMCVAVVCVCYFREELDLYIKEAKQKLRLEVAGNRPAKGRRERKRGAGSGAGGAGAGSRSRRRG